MKRETDVHKSPAVREGDSLIRKFLRACQNRRCTEAFRHLLRAWPVYSTMTLEYEELQDSLKMARAGAWPKPVPARKIQPHGGGYVGLEGRRP